MCIYDLDRTYTGREGRKQIGTKRDKKSEHSAEGLGPLDPPPPLWKSGNPLASYFQMECKRQTFKTSIKQATWHPSTLLFAF